MPIESVGSPSLWIGFTAFVLALLALDLGVFHRQAHEVGFREALAWSVVWIGLALLFNLLVYHWFGAERGLEFLTGYLIEKSLSVDNIFVFLVIFSFFAVPAAYQHRILFWGIVGALVMRAAFIVVGGALLQRFHWVIYLFGAFLVVTGIKLLLHRGAEVRPERNPAYRLFQRFVPAVSGYRGARFTVVENGRRYATPMLLVLLVVEATDLVFAVDSIPAIFAVTSDPFIVYTSNVFAILGLRALYFLLAGAIGRFHYLKVGLGLVLCFVGAKILIASVYQIPIGVSLAVVATILAGSVVASLLRPRAEELPRPFGLRPAIAGMGQNVRPSAKGKNMKPLLKSEVFELPLLFRGKVRDVYDLGDRLLIVATDRLSAFDVVLPTAIPGKGRILTELSNFWFNRTSAIVPNHLTATSVREVVRDVGVLEEIDGRAVVVHRAEPLKIEAVVRGYLAGSGWVDYRRTQSICGIPLPAGLRESERLPEPIFTPSTKAPQGEHDQNIAFDRAVEILGPGLAEVVRQLSLTLYREGSAWAGSRGLIVADTKFEFGLRNGALVLIDEIFTPDSSRFWAAETYEPGRSQASFDKQIVRDYLSSTGWNREPPAPELPAHIVEQTAARYLEVLDRLTAPVSREGAGNT